jgi:hypothetical protein
MLGRFGSLSLLGLSLSLCLFACQKTNNPELQRKEKNLTSSPNSDQVPETDKVTPPTSVTGTYLSCAIDRLASDADPSSQLACALVEASTQKKADLGQLVQNPDFSLSNSGTARVSRLVLNGDPRWHVLFTLRAENKTLANEALKGSQVQFRGTSKAASTPPIQQQTSVTEALASHTNSPPPAAAGLYTQIQALALSNVTSNGQTQYACRGYSSQDRGYHLGRVLGTANSCSFAYATSSENSPVFDYIALPPRPNWVALADGTIPTDALALGVEGNGSPQYLCRANVSAEGLVFGKIASGYGGCNIFASSGYILVTSYEILVP